MVILLTGATGMVGSHLARALVDGGYRVRCLVRRPGQSELLKDLHLEQVGGDVTDRPSVELAMAGVKQVIHTAGVVSYWGKRDEELRSVNVGGTRLLLEVAAESGVEDFILTSSIAAVGYVEGQDVGDEETPYNWGGLGVTYCETKHEAERLVLEEKRLRTVALCPGIIFGPQDIHWNGGRMFAQVLAGGPPAIPPGFTTVSSIQDVVAGHLAALSRGEAGQRYILGGTCCSFQELYANLAAVAGREAPTRVISATLLRMLARVWGGWGDLVGKEPMLTPALAELSTRNRRYSSARAMSVLGYSISPLAPTLEATLRWYRDRGLLPG